MGFPTGRPARRESTQVDVKSNVKIYLWAPVCLWEKGSGSSTWTGLNSCNVRNSCNIGNVRNSCSVCTSRTDCTSQNIHYPRAISNSVESITTTSSVTSSSSVTPITPVPPHSVWIRRYCNSTVCVWVCGYVWVRCVLHTWHDAEPCAEPFQFRPGLWQEAVCRTVPLTGKPSKLAGQMCACALFTKPTTTWPQSISGAITSSLSYPTLAKTFF